MVEEIAAFAEPLVNAIERIIRCLDSVDAEGLNWRPPAPETNSLYVLAFHTMGSAEEAICGVLDVTPRDLGADVSAHGDVWGRGGDDRDRCRRRACAGADGCRRSRAWREAR